ncbi:MAG: FliA/WhiG family RNA polymerase sigma factor [Clostridiales bacterium]|nr:FliA/WhiG family RNA polymerase sigma factor [Clostridiales bacterium]
MARPEPTGDDLWEAYKGWQDEEAYEKLVERYLPLVKYVAGRLAMGLPAHVDMEDLYSYGVFGLLDALRKYDPSRGVKFETYAFTRIRGAILDGLRELDWVPSSLRQKARRLEQAYGALEARLGRPAEDREVAEALGMDEEALQQLLVDISRVTVASLDDAAWNRDEEGEGDLPLRDMVADDRAADPFEEAYLRERQALLAQAIDRLPEKERLVIALYYYEGLTVTEIARVMKLSVSRVSQLHSKAVLRLRGRLSRQREALR